MSVHEGSVFRGTPSSCISSVFPWSLVLKTDSSSGGFAVFFTWLIGHRQFRGTVLGNETFLGAEENSADIQSWQKSVILSCEGSNLYYSVTALEVCTVKNEKGKAEIILVKYLLIVPYPLRLTFPSRPGANTGATPWSSPGMKIKPWFFFLLFHTHFPHVVFPLAAASSGSHCFLSWTLDTLRVEFSVWFLPPRICCLACEGFSTNAAVYFCALNNGTQTEENKALIPKLGEKNVSIWAKHLFFSS